MKNDVLNGYYLKMLEEWEFVIKILKDMLRHRKEQMDSFKKEKNAPVNTTEKVRIGVQISTVKNVREKQIQPIYSVPQTQIVGKMFSNINLVIKQFHDLDEMHVYLKNKPDPSVPRMHSFYQGRICETKEQQLGHKIPGLQNIGVDA